MAECRSCGVAILWVRTQRGHLMPVDREPVRGGNLHIERGIAQVVAPSGALRHVSHYATCPAADKHRKPRDRQLEIPGVKP